MSAAPQLELLRDTAAEIKSSAQRDRLRAAVTPDERPIERGPRGPAPPGGFTPVPGLAAALFQQATGRELTETPYHPNHARTAREQLDVQTLELEELLRRIAPETWRDARRGFWRLVRTARRELRALERRPAISKL